jgi:hypothetical protein
VCGAQLLEQGEQLAELHIQRARDHTRGLLEVTASIAESPAHALHDLALVGGQRHIAMPILESLGRHDFNHRPH